MGDVDEAVMQVAVLLNEVAETHHRVFRITDGEDADWASWYADWLLNLSELPTLLGARPVRSHLVAELVRLDHAYTAQSPDEGWPSFYARDLLRTFGAPGSPAARPRGPRGVELL